jgi:lipid II isoglutaminyl synthase (glutamine-hydrolysing)
MTNVVVILGKLISLLTRTLKIGGGSAAPGYYGLKMYSNLVSTLSTQLPQHIVITGTNGKTTTTKMLAHLLEAQGLKVMRNTTGSNLERGIASTLIQNSNWLGRVKKVDIALWELDEAAFNKVVFQVKPTHIVFLNAFRDQLDRYGEVDTVVSKWYENLHKIDWDSHIYINTSDMTTASLLMAENNHLTKTTFELKDHVMLFEKSLNTQLIDHNEADFVAKITKNRGLEGTEFKVAYAGKSTHIKLNLPGTYNIYNYLAVFAVFSSLGFDPDLASKQIQSFKSAFGRVERVALKNKSGYIFLIKNPAGATTVFETIAPEMNKETVLMLALNDNYADGTDVSWIWDSKFELLSTSLREAQRRSNPKIKKQTSGNGRDRHASARDDVAIIVSGNRAYDMAIRLKYAGIDPKQITVIPDIDEAFTALEQSEEKQFFVLPTYTAMLHIQKILAQKGVKSEYWRTE